MTSPDTIDTIAAAIAGPAWAAMDERDRHGVRQAARRQIERVARALFEDAWYHPWVGPTMKDNPELREKNWLKHADHYARRAVAAILAMPEPVIDEALK